MATAASSSLPPLKEYEDSQGKRYEPGSTTSLRTVRDEYPRILSSSSICATPAPTSRTMMNTTPTPPSAPVVDGSGKEGVVDLSGIHYDAKPSVLIPCQTKRGITVDKKPLQGIKNNTTTTTTSNKISVTSSHYYNCIEYEEDGDIHSECGGHHLHPGPPPPRSRVSVFNHHTTEDLTSHDPFFSSLHPHYPSWTGRDSFMPISRTSPPINTETPINARSFDVAMVSPAHSLMFTFEDFEYDQILGSGASGLCVSALERRTKYPVAIKIISKSYIIDHQVEKALVKEVELHSHLHHPCIVPLYTWLHDKFAVGLVLKYCNGGDLMKAIDKANRALTEQQTARYVFDVVWALRFCHMHSVAHLDLKPENCMLHNDRLLVGDFGMSERLSNTSDKICRKKGTQDYFSPEQVVSDSRFGAYNHKADIWTVGVLAYEIFFGRPPFGSTLDHVDAKQAIPSRRWDDRLHEHFAPKTQEPKQLSPEFFNFLEICLQKVAANRPTAEELFDHPYIVKHNTDRVENPLFNEEPFERNRGFNKK